MAKSKRIIGIDLGSSTSCISTYDGKEVVVIQNSEGRRTTPSIVAFTKDGEIKVGDSAKRQAVTNAKNTIYVVKRLMGKTYDQIKHLKLPYEVINSNGRPAIKIDDRNYSPEEVSAMILKKMKKSAEDYLGEEIERVVITVPAYFNNEEREATKIAGEIAGLKVERIINEPTAAALAYGIDKKGESEKVMVIDIGGSTADFSVLDFGDGVFEVLSTDGDVFLGGENFDDNVIEWLADDFKKEMNIDLRKDPMALQRIKEAVEKAKVELSSSVSTDINLPYITVIDGVPQHLVKTLTRAKFEEINNSLFEKINKLTLSALKKSKLSVDKIDEIIMVGGSTRIPKIQQEAEKMFGKPVNKSVNPDEAVSIGATIQGGVLTGEVKDILLLDVLPISLGIETMGGVFTKLVEANTTIPVKKSQVFSTAVDNQPSVEIHVLQGERAKASDNRTLGKFHLDGLPPAQRGTPQIEVELNVDANSILTVTAKDLGTGKQQNIRIENTTSLSKEEIERMKNDAIANEAADKKFKEEVDKINATETLIFTTEKSLTEYGDKITEATKSSVIESLSKLKEAKDKRDFTEIDKITTELNSTLSKFYEEIQAASQSAESTPPNEESDSTSDTPYEEVK